MKFIKLSNESYINAEKVLKFFIDEFRGDYFVYAELGIEDAAAIDCFKTLGEAQAWLDNFVAELNAEDKS